MSDDNETPDHYVVTNDDSSSWYKDYIDYVHGNKEWPEDKERFRQLPRTRLATKSEVAAVFGMHTFFYCRERTRWEKFLAKIHLLNAWHWIRNRFATFRWRRRER